MLRWQIGHSAACGYFVYSYLLLSHRVRMHTTRHGRSATSTTPSVLLLPCIFHNNLVACRHVNVVTASQVGVSTLPLLF
ncbi:unnamed protein product [Periconia digitata]|uniref:Uncharacterized protein n=1 Tax=Periconia digitata TaxID=1303443 RepID=A0A9W4URD2_9PLEO|nr:unnamed protein product [Periconia digitata]